MVGPNDFASMEEAVYRRYLRIINEGAGLPDLIIIDGGKGQLSSTIKSLKKLGVFERVGRCAAGVITNLRYVIYALNHCLCEDC